MTQTQFLVFEVKKELKVGDLVHITVNPDGSYESPELEYHAQETKEDVATEPEGQGGSGENSEDVG